MCLSALISGELHVQEIFPQRRERIDQPDAGSEKLNAMRDVGGNGVAVARLEVYGRFVTQEKEDLALCHVTDLLVRMLVQRVRLSLGSIIEIEDDQHQVVSVRDPALDTGADDGHR